MRRQTCGAKLTGTWTCRLSWRGRPGFFLQVKGGQSRSLDEVHNDALPLFPALDLARLHCAVPKEADDLGRRFLGGAGGGVVASGDEPAVYRGDLLEGTRPAGVEARRGA